MLILTCIQNSNRRFEIIGAQLQNCLRFALGLVGPCPSMNTKKFVGRVALGQLDIGLGQ